MAAGDLVADDGADNPVDVGDGEFGRDLFALLDGRLADVQQPGHVDGFIQTMILGFGAVAAHIDPHVGSIEDVAEVEPLGLPVGDGLLRLQPVGATDHLVEGAETELGP